MGNIYFCDQGWFWQGRMRLCCCVGDKRQKECRLLGMRRRQTRLQTHGAWFKQNFPQFFSYHWRVEQEEQVWNYFCGLSNNFQTLFDEGKYPIFLFTFWVSYTHKCRPVIQHFCCCCLGILGERSGCWCLVMLLNYKMKDGWWVIVFRSYFQVYHYIFSMTPSSDLDVIR